MSAMEAERSKMRYIKNLKKLNNSGTTLGEMILVCFLVGLISLIVAQTVVFSYRMTAEISSDSYAADVSEMILNQAADVISQAKAPGDRKIYFADDGKIIAFEVANSSPVIIYTTDTYVVPRAKYTSADDEYGIFESESISVSNVGYMNMYYCQLKTGESNQPASLWTFSEKTYMDYVIKSLTFTPVSHNGKLSVLINLVIRKKDGSGEDYQRSTTVNCVNVEAFTDTSNKIGSGKDFIFNFLGIIWNEKNDPVIPPTESEDDNIYDELTVEEYTKKGIFNNIINKIDILHYWDRNNFLGKAYVEHKLSSAVNIKTISLLNECISIPAGAKIYFDTNKYNFEMFIVKQSNLLEEMDLYYEYVSENKKINSENGIACIEFDTTSKIVLNVKRKNGDKLNIGDLSEAINNIKICIPK